MKSGYFLAFRNVWRHPAFKNLIESAIWLYIVSNASHKDKELKFMENPVFVKRSELIFPIRKNASIWKMPYSSMRAFIQRLRRKRMITTRLATINPHRDHKYKSVTIISVVNYDKFQQYDPNGNRIMPTSEQLLNNNTNTYTNISLANGDKSEYKILEEWGHEQIILKDGKKYRKHKWKNIPLELIK